MLHVRSCRYPTLFSFKRTGALRRTVGRQDDRFDPCLCRIEPCLTQCPQLLALFVQANRFIERCFAAFQLVDDFFQRLQRFFESGAIGFVAHADSFGVQPLSGQAFRKCDGLRGVLAQFYFAHHRICGIAVGLMKNKLLLIAPLSMLALAACNKSETPAAEGDAAKTAEAPAAPVELPPSITASAIYRCADNTILYVDFLGKNEAADIRVGDKSAPSVRVTAPKAEAPAEGAAPAADAEAAPAGPMKSADGTATLAGSGKQINVKLADKGAQTCKSN